MLWPLIHIICAAVQMVSRELERECIIVFDEAHNIDNVCIEALSVNLRQQTLDGAARNIGRLERVGDVHARAADRCWQCDEVFPIHVLYYNNIVAQVKGTLCCRYDRCSSDTAPHLLLHNCLICHRLSVLLHAAAWHSY